MKKIKISKKIVEYLIQLSVVVLGIFITFGINDLIKVRQDRKEFQVSLSFLKEELKNNLERVQNTRKGFEHLANGTEQFRQVRWDSRKLPIDTLKKYSNLAVFIPQFSYNQYAMDMIKNKSTYISFRNGSILYDLFNCYGELQMIRVWTNLYTDRVTAGFVGVAIDPMYKYTESGDFVAYWDYLMKYPGVRNQIMDYTYFRDRTIHIRWVEEVIGRVLDKLEKELRE